MSTVALFAVVAVGLALAGDALARPGGGSSYSGGSSRSSSRSGGSSGGGSSGGGGILIDLFAFLLRLCIEAPGIGIPLLLVVAMIVIGVFVAKSRTGALREWNVGAPDVAHYAPPPAAHGPAHAAHGAPRARLEELRRVDENFSLVLFEDFLAALYVEIQMARGKQALARLGAYVAPGAQASLTSPGLLEVRNVLVGAMRFAHVELAPHDPSPEARIRVEVELESNFTEVHPGPKEQSFYARERWRLARKRGVLSRTPDRARIFPCPSCGAPLDQVIAGVCRHCGQNVSTGGFDWLLEDVRLLECETRGPMLTATTEERGNELSTVIDPNAQARLRSLSAKDPAFDWMAFQARVGLIFTSFQAGWANRDLEPLRPFFTDNLFHVQAYWVEAYRRQRLRNVTERAGITGIHLARVTSDKFFDAITVRVFATGLDYTLTDDGKLVAGHRSRERAYTEYWTLVRGTGRKGPTRTDPVCPSCGAPLAISMAGTCTYCQAKVTSGEFDWVLSRIEQDESYEA